MARRRIIRETPLDDEQQTAIDLPTGGKMEFPEPAKLVEESVELTAAETLLIDQMIMDRLQDAQQPQEKQEAQASTGEPQTGDQRHMAVEAAQKAAGTIESFTLEPKFKEGIARQVELQRLAQLPLSQIEELPQEKRELVWQELAQQIITIPDNVLDTVNAKVEALAQQIAKIPNLPTVVEGMEAIKKNAAQFAAQFETFRNCLPDMRPLLDQIEKPVDTLLSDTTQKALDVMIVLAPYIKAEADENPELYKTPGTPAGTLIAAAARRARADGKKIPLLKAEKGPDKEGTRRKHLEEAHKRREAAKQEGGLIAGGTRLATIADKGLGFDYFTSEVCKLLPAGIENYILDDQGRINLYDLTGSDKEIQEVLQEVDGLHTAFLMWLLGLAWNNSDIRETNSGNAIMPVYLPAVLEEMRIDPRPRERDKETGLIKKRDTEKTLQEMRLDKFMGFLNPLNKVAAWFGGDLYAIAGFDHYSRESETVYIRTPYMFRLVEYAKLHATKHGAIKNIFHADIMTENQTAVEIANRIAMGLITRGVTREDGSTYQNPQKPIKRRTTRTAVDGTKTVVELTFAPETETTVTKSRTDENGITTTISGTPRKKEKVFTFDIRFSSLIADCPQLQRELEEIHKGQGEAEKEAREANKTAEEIEAARRSDHKNDSQRVNKKLKDTFTAAIRIIMEKSEIPKYYKGLTIRTARFDTFKAPTNSTLSDRMIITHHGKNPNFAG